MESAFENSLKNQINLKIDEKKEFLLERNEINSSPKRKEYLFSFYRSSYCIKDYDDSCEDHSKIEKAIILDYSILKLVLFSLLNIITCFSINLLVVWYPQFKLYFFYKKTNINDGKFVGVYGLGKNEHFF